MSFALPRPALLLSLAAAALLLAGAGGTLAGARLALAEATNLPPALLWLALLLLQRGTAGLQPSLGWALAGALAALLVLGAAVLGGFAPGRVADAGAWLGVAWLLLLALLAWRDAAARWCGPLLALCIASTGAGPFVARLLAPLLSLVPLDPSEALPAAAGMLAALLMVFGGAGLLAWLARSAARWLRPTRGLALLALLGALGKLALLLSAD